MSYQKCTEVEKLILGQKYLVPCVHTPTWIQGGFEAGDFVPVLGGVHRDPELKADYWHFHYDRRFIPYDRAISVGAVIAVTPREFNDLICHFPQPDIEVFWKIRKCYRLDAAIPEDALHILRIRLEPLYQHHKMQCKVCPHRGVPLNAIEPDHQGVIRCPAHGLRWREDTGELVSSGGDACSARSVRDG